MASSNPLEILSPEECFQIITKHLNSFNFDVENYQIERVNDSNIIGYIGEYYWLKIDVKVDLAIRNLRFFIKSMPRDNENKRAHVKLYFEKERGIYNDIFEEYDAAGEWQWKPKSLLLRDDLLVLENLQDHGYKHKTIYGDGLDQLHIECLLKTVAEMHATSFGLEKSDINLTAKHGQLFTEVNVTPDNIWMAYQFEAIKHVFLNVPELQHFINDNNIEAAFFEKIPEHMFAVFKQSTIYRNVFSHGDPWISNVMFKYSTNKDGSEIPQRAILVDFQLCRFVPPAIDVLLAIFFNTRRENREKYFEYYLAFYWHNLRQKLASKKINIDEQLPLSQFRESCGFYKYLILVFNCRYIFAKMKPGTLQLIERDDPEKFSKICSTDRGQFTVKIMKEDAVHREIVLEIFGELLEEYLLLNKKLSNLFCK